MVARLQHCGYSSSTAAVGEAAVAMLHSSSFSATVPVRLKHKTKNELDEKQSQPHRQQYQQSNISKAVNRLHNSSPLYVKKDHASSHRTQNADQPSRPVQSESQASTRSTNCDPRQHHPQATPSINESHTCLLLIALTMIRNQSSTPPIPSIYESHTLTHACTPSVQASTRSTNCEPRSNRHTPYTLNPLMARAHHMHTRLASKQSTRSTGFNQHLPHIFSPRTAHTHACLLPHCPEI